MLENQFGCLVSHVPETQQIEAAQNFLEPDYFFSREYRVLAESILDPRMDSLTWRNCLARELTAYAQWLFRKLLDAGKLENNKSGVVGGEIACLLPSYAPALHLLRRAIPFSVLEIPVICSFHPAIRTYSEYVCQQLRTLLNVRQDTLRVWSHEPKLLCEAVAKDGHIVGTGRISTLSMLKSKYKNKFIGAGGRCGVVVCRQRKGAMKLYHAIGRGPRPSCSTPRVYLSLEAEANISEILHRFHPSIVYVDEAVEFGPDAQDYCIKVINRNGLALDISGFAKDPVFGWIGDYMA